MHNNCVCRIDHIEIFTKTVCVCVGGGALWQFSEWYYIVHTTRGKKKEKGIKLAWEEFFLILPHYWAYKL